MKVCNHRFSAMLAVFGIASLAAAPAIAANPPKYEGKEEARNVRLLGKHDLAGRTAYQPTIHRQGNRWIAYVGHHGGRKVNPLTGQLEENGTSIIDVTDPKAAKLLVHLPGEKGVEVPGRETGGAQMARLCDGDTLPRGEKGKVYMLRTFGDSHQEVWDVTTPEKPAMIAKFGSFKSSHKNDWECDTGIAYIPGSDEAYRATRVNNIWDLSDPKTPKFIRAFGLPDQLKDAKGFNPGQIHGSISAGVQANRIYIGYGTNRRGVAQIVDRKKLLEGPPEPTRENLLSPQIARIDLPEFMGAHTTFPLLGVDVPEFARDKVGSKRDFLVVVNETNITVCNEHRQIGLFLRYHRRKAPGRCLELQRTREPRQLLQPRRSLRSAREPREPDADLSQAADVLLLVQRRHACRRRPRSLPAQGGRLLHPGAVGEDRPALRRREGEDGMRARGPDQQHGGRQPRPDLRCRSCRHGAVHPGADRGGACDRELPEMTRDPCRAVSDPAAIPAARG